MVRSWAPVFHEVEISAGQTSPIRSSHTAGVSSSGLFTTGIQKEILVRQVIFCQVEESGSGRAEKGIGKTQAWTH